MAQQRVLITAGANGIGAAIAERFAADGAAIFVCDVDAAGLDRLAARLPGVTMQVCDLGRREAIAPMVDAAARTLGGIDVLVNNAGVGGATAPTHELDPAEWDQVMGINLDATFLVTRAAIPHLKTSPGGVIINLSSVAGRFGYPNRIAYATSKWGLIGFTKTLSMELGADGIRVNALLPGGVDGERLQRVMEGRSQLSGQSLETVREEAMSYQSLKYFVNPKHVADMAAFLASESGRSISGQALSIDNDMQRT
ncbi:MAG: SDR family oxidoreductase [Pigmentiphaga sp.]